MNTWKLEAGRVYRTADNKYIIKNVGYKCWGLFINDGSSDWDIDWVGSTYPSIKAAQAAAELVAA